MIWPWDVSEVRERWAKMIDACHEVGRDPSTLELTIGTHVHLPERGHAVPDERAISGSYAEIADRLRFLASAGVSHTVILFRPDANLATIEQFGHVLELLDRG